MTEEMTPLNRPEDEASRREAKDSDHRPGEYFEPVEEQATEAQGMEEPLPEEEIIGELLPEAELPGVLLPEEEYIEEPLPTEAFVEEPLPSIQTEGQLPEILMEEQLPEVQIEESLAEVQAIEEPYLESPEEQVEPVEVEAEAHSETEGRPSTADLWPRSPFYLRFPWILAGPLAAAMILWFGSGAVLSATIAAPRPTSTPQAVAVAKVPPTATPAQATPAPAQATPAQATQAPATPAPVAAVPTATPKPKPTPFPMAVYNTDGDGIYLNRMAGGGSRIRGWPDRTVLQVIGEDQQLNGQTWRNVRDPQGNEGWVLAQYLVDPSRLPAATATPTPKPATPTPAATASASGTATPGAATGTPAATATRAAATASPTPSSSPTPRP